MSLPIRSSQENCNTDSALSPSSPSGRSQQASSSWRSWLRVHPAAELFPIPSDDDIRALADDIRRHGQREPVSFIRDDKGLAVLLDGVTRLDARESTGLKIDLADRAVFEQLSSTIDATAFVISKNIHRRHLTAEQKRDLIAKLLKADPEKSDRQVAGLVKADHKTVGAVRSEMEGRGEIPHVEKRADTKGRQQPAKKAPKVNPERPRPAVTSNPDHKADGPNPLVAAWDKANSKQRHDFVLARKIEIMRAQQEIGKRAHEPDDGRDITDHIEARVRS
jgi:hypothetical protein